MQKARWPNFVSATKWPVADVDADRNVDRRSGMISGTYKNSSEICWLHPIKRLDNNVFSSRSGHHSLSVSGCEEGCRARVFRSTKAVSKGEIKNV